LADSLSEELALNLFKVTVLITDIHLETNAEKTKYKIKIYILDRTININAIIFLIQGLNFNMD